MSNAIRHFLDIADFEGESLRKLLDVAHDWKLQHKAGTATLPLTGKHLAMVFEKSSTRTRVSFEVGMQQLGGNVSTITSQNSQLGRGESVADTARTLAGYVDAIMLRCYHHESLQQMAEYAGIPVINGLTDFSHPVQVMTDIMTLEESVGHPIQGRTVAWVGDGNNMSISWIHAAVKMGFILKLSYPENFKPFQHVLDWAREQQGSVIVCDTPQEAVEGADLVTTDTWLSMHDEDSALRKRIFQPYQVNAQLMSLAHKDAVFMHCLPAKRGEEVTAEVMDGPQSVVWQEAENRLHLQKAILLWCMHAV